jgi:hypothetical protein
MEWVERLLDNYGKLRLAGEAKDLEDNRKMLEIDRAVVQAHHRRNLGKDFLAAGDGSDGDDMIHIGDRYEHLHSAPSPSAGGRLLRLVLGAALLASGVGGGFGLALLADALRQPVASPIIPPPERQPPKPEALPAADHDTLFELRLGPPD